MTRIDQDDKGILTHQLSAALRRVENLSEFSRRSGLNLRQLTRYMSEGVEPSASVLVKICRELGMSIEELLYGAKDVAATKNVSSLSEEMVMIPQLDVYASAGPGSRNDAPDIVSRMAFPAVLLRHYGVKEEDAHFITARGDSMLPTIADGQLLLVNRAVRRVKNQAIYVVSLDGDVQVKRVDRSLDGSVTLISDNKAHIPVLLVPADAERLLVEGHVFWGGKEIR